MARILVVDDVKEMRGLVAQFLNQTGHEVLTAGDAMEAMELLNSFRIDLAILDIEMPYTNGIQLSQALRASLRYKFLPIVFLTARREKKDVERALEVQFEKYLLKPIDRERLLSTVNAIFDKTRPREHDHIEASRTTLSLRADIVRRVETKLVIISETGFVIKSEHHFASEEIVQIDTSFFEQVGIPALPLKVGGQRQLGPNEWLISLSFSHLNQDISVKIKTWLLAQLQKIAG